MSALQDQPYQPRPEIIEDPPATASGFDLRTHVKNARTGELVKYQPYNLRIVSGTRYFERPIGSGNLFFESGEHAGRFVSGTIDPAAAHVEFRQETPRSKEDLEKENDQLRQELAALEAEKEAKMKMAPQAQAPRKS